MKAIVFVDFQMTESRRHNGRRKLVQPNIMQIRKIFFSVFVLGAILSASNAQADPPFGRLAPYWRTPTPYFVGNPKVIQPEKHRVALSYVDPAMRKTEKHAYPYGFFGAQTRLYTAKSSGYYEAYNQRSYGWGY
jgi:hypothetical protein